MKLEIVITVFIDNPVEEGGFLDKEQMMNYYEQVPLDELLDLHEHEAILSLEE